MLDTSSFHASSHAPSSSSVVVRASRTPECSDAKRVSPVISSEIAPVDAVSVVAVAESGVSVAESAASDVESEGATVPIEQVPCTSRARVLNVPPEVGPVAAGGAPLWTPDPRPQRALDEVRYRVDVAVLQPHQAPVRHPLHTA